MKLAERLLRQLKQTRARSEKLLCAFQTPEDWTYQLAPGTNHALWFAGHMAVTDNMFIGIVAPERATDMLPWDKLFGLGSQPTSDPDHYPPPAEVLDLMRERREVLVELLAGLSDKQLAKPTPDGTFDFLPDYGSVWEVAVSHESLHAGQVTMIRRALGHTPLFNAVPAEAT
jgi:uncharacterized damage-inducible protein DinB